MTNLNLKALLSCNEVASQEKTRYYLQGVYTHCEDGKRVYVSTDGHALVKIEEKAECDSGEALIIPSEVIENCAKLFKSDLKAGLVSLELSDKCLKGYDKSIGFTPVDGQYPDYKRVIPSGNKDIGEISIDSDILARIGKAQKIYTGLKKSKLDLQFTDVRSPIRINTGCAWSAVFMPYIR